MEDREILVFGNIVGPQITQEQNGQPRLVIKVYYLGDLLIQVTGKEDVVFADNTIIIGRIFREIAHAIHVLKKDRPGPFFKLCYGLVADSGVGLLYGGDEMGVKPHRFNPL
jgi:hypothetical protein